MAPPLRTPLTTTRPERRLDNEDVVVGGAIPVSPSASRPIAGAPGAVVATRSILVVDCGSTFTKVALLAQVEDRFRLLASVQEPSTIAPPANDVMIGLREALARIEQVTGRSLLREGELLTPQTADGDGVDAVALSTSAGGPLRVLATGPGRDALAGLLQRSIGGFFVHLDALPLLPVQGTAGPDAQQLVASIRALQPHAIVVIGSSFAQGAAAASIEESARSVASWVEVLARAGGEDRPREADRLPVIVSGSSTDTAAVRSALEARGLGSTSLTAVEILSPSTLGPLNRAVGALYEVSVLHSIPGFTSLRALSKAPAAATITATAGLARYLAQHFQTNVVGVDVGASATKLVGATAQGEFLPAVHPAAGVGLGAGSILRATGMANVLRWLDFPASEDELREYVFYRMLRPRALPANERELAFEHALAREAIALALRAPGSRLAGLHPMSIILGAGGVLANAPTPGLAAMTLLDALQPRGISSLVLDTAHIATALGSVAGLDTRAAAEVAESDAVILQLGTVVSAVGSPQEGQPAVQAVLEFADGRRHTEQVSAGTIARLPLAPGEQAMFGLTPAPTVDIGLGPGQQARASEPVEGGALGLVVDARGRPFVLPTDPDERMRRISEWRRALMVEE